MVKKTSTVDVEALYQEVVATPSAQTPGFIEVLLTALPQDVADQALALLKDGPKRNNRSVAATLERLRVMFKVEVKPGEPDKALGSDHVMRWRSARGIKY